MDMPYSSSKMWKSLAQEALVSSGQMQSPSTARKLSSKFRYLHHHQHLCSPSIYAHRSLIPALSPPDNLFRSAKSKEGSPRKFMRDKRRTYRKDGEAVKAV